ncbi:MAG: YitT family protein [Bacteroidales bacterium]|nr:YitT family protein [Bacteroidales bacterium]
MEKKRTNVYLVAKDYVTILFGLILYSIGWTAFLLPNQITTGGVAGIGALIFYATGTIPIAVTYAVINGVLLLISIKILGFKFSIRTIFGVVVLTILLSVFQHYIKKGFVDEPFMATVIGAILCGAGVGVVFSSNGSTGGTDIVAAVINKYRNITIGRVILYSDVMIILSSYFIFHSIEKIVYGLTVMAIMTYTLDLVINGNRQSVQFLIFSSKYEEIADRIIQLPRGVTVVDGTGWYSKQPTKVLLVLAKRSESIAIFRLVKEVDPNAFVSQSPAIGVYGQGFDQMKT